MPGTEPPAAGRGTVPPAPSRKGERRGDVLVSCLVDAQPKFRLQSLNWIASLLATGTAGPEAICVHLVNDHPGVFHDVLARIGVTVVETAPLGTAASPYCNKLAQLKSRRLREAGHVALFDADVVVARDLSAALAGPGVRAKTADTAVPLLAQLTTLARRAGLPLPLETTPTDFGHGDTARGYCNGGLYLFDGPTFRRLGPYWIKWAGWALARERLLGPSVKHADQVAFLLALLETGQPATLLPLAMNFPTHLKKTTYAPAHDLPPAVIHYHDRLDADGLLIPPGLPRVDAVIATVNARLRAFHKAFVPPLVTRQFRDTRENRADAS